MERSCRTEGSPGCVRCCVDLVIDQPDIKKPAGVPCPKLVDDGQGGQKCSIYAKGRPRVCRDYKCGWLVGALDDDERPDKSGFLVTSAMGRPGVAEAFRMIREAGMDVWQVMAIPGMEGDSDRLDQIVKRLRRKGAVLSDKEPGITGNNKAMRIFFRWFYGS